MGFIAVLLIAILVVLFVGSAFVSALCHSMREGDVLGFGIFALMFTGACAICIYAFNQYRHDYTHFYKYIKSNQLLNALKIIEKGNIGFDKAIMIADLAKLDNNTKVEIASLVYTRHHIGNDYTFNKRLADLYLSTKDYTNALLMYDTIEIPIYERLSIYEQCGAYDKLLDLCNNIKYYIEPTNELVSIADVKIGDICDKVDEFIQAGNINVLSRIYSLQGKYELYAKLHETNHDYYSALWGYKKLHNYVKIAEMYELLNDYKNAGDAYYKLGMFEKASACFSRASLK